MSVLANHLQRTNPITRSTLTRVFVGTWRDELSHRDITETLYKYQCGADRHTITVWHKKAKPLSTPTSM